MRDPEKNREAQRRWYAKNKELQVARNKTQRSNKYKWFREYKSRLKCSRCEENHPAALDFHHKEGEVKTESVSYMANSGYSIEQVKNEINKCEVLCANCHRKLHWKGD